MNLFSPKFQLVSLNIELPKAIMSQNYDLPIGHNFGEVFSVAETIVSLSCWNRKGMHCNTCHTTRRVTILTFL